MNFFSEEIAKTGAGGDAKLKIYFARSKKIRGFVTKQGKMIELIEICSRNG